MLLTDFFLETDPTQGTAFLMAILVERRGELSVLQTVHIRAPGDRHQALRTPIPVLAGDTLHVLLSSATPSEQSVIWNIGGYFDRRAKVVGSVGVPHVRPAGASPHPLPVVELGSDLQTGRITAVAAPTVRIDGVFVGDFIASAQSGNIARVLSFEGDAAHLDRSLGFVPGDAYAMLLAATAGSRGNVIVNEKISCDGVKRVVFVHPLRQIANLHGCIPGQITVDTSFDFAPGQLFQLAP